MMKSMRKSLASCCGGSSQSNERDSLRTDYKNPKRLGHVTQSVYVYVDDVDQHYERAKLEGMTIIAEPEDQFYGDRRYGAEDPEGQQWYFAQQVRDVAPEDVERTTTTSNRE